MRWNNHSNLAGRHAVLSPSKYHWIRYSDEKLDRLFDTAMTAARGTDFHALAHHLIRLKTMLPRRRSTLNMYVNDCILWRMDPEVMLLYSALCFGTADCISFETTYCESPTLRWA